MIELVSRCHLSPSFSRSQPHRTNILTSNSNLERLEWYLSFRNAIDQRYCTTGITTLTSQALHHNSIHSTTAQFMTAILITMPTLSTRAWELSSSPPTSGAIFAVRYITDYSSRHLNSKTCLISMDLSSSDTASARGKPGMHRGWKSV